MRLSTQTETRELLTNVFINTTKREAERLLVSLQTLAIPERDTSILGQLRTQLQGILSGSASTEGLGAADRHLAQINAERFGAQMPPPEYKPWRGTAGPLPNSGGPTARMNAAMEEVHDHLLEATDKESLSRISTRRMLRDLYRKGFHAGVDWHKAQQNVTEEMSHYRSLTTTWKNRATTAESEIRQLRARRESLTEKWRERAEHFREQVRKGYDAQAGVKARMVDVMSSELNDRFNRTIEPESLEPVDEPTPLPDINASSNQVQRQLDGAARELGIRLSQKDRQILTTLWSTAYSQGVVDNEKRWSS